MTSLDTRDTPDDAIDLLASDASGFYRVRTPRLGLSINGAGDAIAALFNLHWKRSGSAAQALDLASASIYGLLKRMSDNPMVMLNHAIAAGMAHGPQKGLELLTALDSDARLAGHHRLDAVRAHLFEMAGDRESAIAHYQIAAGRTTSLPERNYLIAQAARLREG